MSNVLGDDKRHQIVALGRLGWSLRRIEQATGVRRETISGYLKAAGIVMRGPGRPTDQEIKTGHFATEVSTDSVPNPAISRRCPPTRPSDRAEHQVRVPASRIAS